MISYLKLMHDVLENGEHHDDRTDTGTKSVFGYQWSHNMRDGFPLLTTKRVHFHSIVCELLWFLRGDTNTGWLKDNGVSIWDEWADENGDLGPVYGRQWRDFGGVDQIERLINDIQSDPFSRRLIVSAWNPVDVPAMKLPPCHMFWQVKVHGDNSISLRVDMRSTDVFLGLPFNIASYGLLLEMIARCTGMTARKLVFHFGDLHVYSNHFDQCNRQMSRPCRDLPELDLAMEHSTGLDGLFAVKPEDVSLIGYDPHPPIKATVAV